MGTRQEPRPGQRSQQRRRIAAAGEHALALRGDGTVLAWGNNQYGQLGNGRGGFESATGEDQRVPRLVAGLSGVRAIASGGGSNFALLANGTVMAWGSNTKGQLGIEWPETCQRHKTAACAQYECSTETGEELCSTRPQLVMTAAKKPLSEVVAVAAGEEAGYALLRSGKVLSWGTDIKGQLGQAGLETGPHSKFVPPGYVMKSATQPLEGVVELAAGYNHVLARLAGGAVFGWGDNERGELGATTPATSEVSRSMPRPRARRSPSRSRVWKASLPKPFPPEDATALP